MPLATSCGSVTTSATVLMGPLITPAAPSVAMMSAGCRSAAHAPMICVDLVLMAPAGDVVDEAVVGGQLGLVDCRTEPAEHGVLVRGDDHPAAVGARVDVGRRDALEPGARRSANHAADVVVRDRGFLHRQARFGQCGVDDLTLACHRPAVQRGERTLRGEHACQAVAE